MEGKTKLTNEELDGDMMEDMNILIKDNELLTGVIDKN